MSEKSKERCPECGSLLKVSKVRTFPRYQNDLVVNCPSCLWTADDPPSNAPLRYEQEFYDDD